MDNNTILRRLSWMGWACAKGDPTDKDLAAAIAHYAKKYGRRPAMIAIRERNGLTPPGEVQLITWPAAPVGVLYLALPERKEA